MSQASTSDEKRFHRILRSIIGNRIGDATAAKFGMRRQVMNRYLRGVAVPLRPTIDKNNWRVVFETLFPETWSVNKEAFEFAYEKNLKPFAGWKKPLVFKKPENKESIGYVFWLIIRTKPELSWEDVATKLALDLKYLHGIISDRIILNRQSMRIKNSRALFRKHFSEGWALYELLYEKAFWKLPAKTLAAATKEPDDKNGIGHLLWLMIRGKEHGAATLAAERLSISKPQLCNYIYGVSVPTAAIVKDKDWINVLQNYYPETWAQHGPAFQVWLAAHLQQCEIRIAKKAAAQILTQRCPKRATEPREVTATFRKAKERKREDNGTSDADELGKNLKLLAGEIFQHIRTSRGDDIQDLTTSMRDVAMRENYENIENGNDSVQMDLYLRTHREIGRLYNLAPDDPDDIRLSTVMRQARRLEPKAIRKLGH